MYHVSTRTWKSCVCGCLRIDMEDIEYMSVLEDKAKSKMKSEAVYIREEIRTTKR